MVLNIKEYSKKLLFEFLIEKFNSLSKYKDSIVELANKLPIFRFDSAFKSRFDAESENIFITTECIFDIKNILNKLNIKCSDEIFDKSHCMFALIKQQNYAKLFELIEKSNFSLLTTKERYILFSNLKKIKFIDEIKLKRIHLFKNVNGNYRALQEMIAYRNNAPKWLSDYVICEEDNNNDLCEYLIDKENEFKDIIQKDFTNIKAPLIDIYNEFSDKWDGQFTKYIINTHQYTKNLDLVRIIEESNTEIKKYYLNNIDNIFLDSNLSYNKNSYEYRILKIILSVFDQPSDYSSNIYFDGQCIKHIYVRDDVLCIFKQNGEDKKIKMSLSNLLPQYKNKSNLIDKIKNLFSPHIKDLIKIFDAKPLSLSVISSELDKYLCIPERRFSNWNIDGNAYQYLFATYYRRHIKSWDKLFVPTIDLSNKEEDFIKDLMNFLFENNISIDSSPFTYHIKNYFCNKFFNSSYTIDSEQLLPSIQKWADSNEKKQYLYKNGIRDKDKDYSIKFRKLFIENKKISIDIINNIIGEDLISDIKFITTTKISTLPFTGEHQKEVLLFLKHNNKCEFISNINNLLLDDSIEMSSCEYNEWINDSHPNIYIYSGMLPYRLYLNDTLLLDYNDGYFFYDKHLNKLFISDIRKKEDILFEIAKSNNTSFNFEDYKVLFINGKTSVSEIEMAQKEKKIQLLENDNLKKDILIAEYKRRFGDIDKDIINCLYDPNSNFGNASQLSTSIPSNNALFESSEKVIKRNTISKKEQIIAHNEAERIIKENLEKNGYDCSNWTIEDKEYNIESTKWHIDNIVTPDNKHINLVIKSAKAGIIYLSASEFAFLTSDSDNILMVWDGNNIHNVTSDDIFNNDSTINLIFDKEYTPKHYYVALSKVFQYVKKTTFAVKNPSYNAYDSIKSFGLDSKTNGIQNVFDDEDL